MSFFGGNLPPHTRLFTVQPPVPIGPTASLAIRTPIFTGSILPTQVNPPWQINVLGVGLRARGVTVSAAGGGAISTHLDDNIITGATGTCSRGTIIAGTWPVVVAGGGTVSFGGVSLGSVAGAVTLICQIAVSAVASITVTNELTAWWLLQSDVFEI